MGRSDVITKVYYQLKPFIPRRVQIWLRRKVALRKRKVYSNVWPILEKAGTKPDGWPGWPHHRRFALVLTHDVESEAGQRKCHELMDLENQLGFRSSFNFVPERYHVSAQVRHMLITNGFEVGVHGLNHDGKLYRSRNMFRERAQKINSYLKEWNAVGFRSPAVHHNLEWIRDLGIEYDSSTFDTDPFQPQTDGVETLFPFRVSGNLDREGYVELPYTLPQDFDLFVLMKETNTDIWRQKLDWVAAQGGMALLITHPDYMSFDGSKPRLEEYPATYYAEFLRYINTQYGDQYWHALPREVASFVRSESTTQDPE
jgi:peptidoglycan/xylan/chitin deacetylase (PgdA/CDA1 family)